MMSMRLLLFGIVVTISIVGVKFMITKAQALDLLSDIATDKDERTTERLKAIEMLSKFSEFESSDYNNGVTFVDDIPSARD